MKYSFIYFIGMMCLLTIFSCSKEIDIQANEAKQEESANFRSETLDLPIANGDHYSFRDFDHLTNFYQSLDVLYSQDDSLFNLTVSQELSGINSVYNKLVTDEFVNPSQRYQPFLTDPIMMAIVNEYFEFEVDNVLITYMNNSDLLISDPNDLVTKNQIRNMSKGGDLDFNLIPEKAYWGEDTNPESLRPWCGCSINIEQISCDEVRVYGTCKNLVFGDGGGLVTINVSNSIFPPQTHNVDGNFSFIVAMATTGPNITIYATANPNCFFNKTVSATYVFDPSGDACDFNERSTPYLWAQDPGIQGFSHRTSYYKNFWSSYEQAEMWSKYWDGNTWRLNNAELALLIDAKRKDSNCIQIDHEYQSKSKYRSNLGVRVNTGIFGQKRFVYHCDGDVTGVYNKTLNWQGTSWTIEATGIIDFECCE